MKKRRIKKGPIIILVLVVVVILGLIIGIIKLVPKNSKTKVKTDNNTSTTKTFLFLTEIFSLSKKVFVNFLLIPIIKTSNSSTIE